MRGKFTSLEAPAPQGPYSHGIITSGKLLRISGQLPIDALTGQIVGDDFETQAIQTFENLKTIVEAAGSNLTKVVKVQMYLKDIYCFDEANAIYKIYFSEPYPARTTIQTQLRISLIEVDAVVALE